MKTVIAVLFSLLSTFSLFASSGDDDANDLKSIRSKVASELSVQLSYNELADSFKEGVAFAEVLVLPSGKLKVIHVNAATYWQRDIIRKEIESLFVDLPLSAVGKQFAFKLAFSKRSA